MRIIALPLVFALLGAGCAAGPQYRTSYRAIAGISAAVGVGLLAAAGAANECDESQHQCDGPGEGFVFIPPGLLMLGLALGFAVASSSDEAPAPTPAPAPPTRRQTQR